jgi:hypothetical protein
LLGFPFPFFLDFLDRDSFHIERLF